jgi:hypothetical protein
MDQNSQQIVEATGVHSKSMDLIDSLTSAALAVGQGMPEGYEIDGDPLFGARLALAAYIATLEQVVAREATAKGVTPEQLGVSYGLTAPVTVLLMPQSSELQ